jgi:hypothetical protein
MVDVKQTVEKRFRDLEASVSGLQRLLDAQRIREVRRPNFPISGSSLTPEEVDAEVLYAREHAERINAKYQPLESAINDHIQGLAAFESDIKGMIHAESRPQFGSRFFMNAFYFVLGSAVSAFSLLAFLGWK